MLRHIRLPISNIIFPVPVPVPKRTLSTSAILSEKALPPRLKLNDADITISYLKGTGPGGQKINKTNSAVQLIHKPTNIVIKSQATRSRSQNEKIARQILADKVEQALKGDHSRVALKAARERKKKASRVKKSRRKYRDLDGKIVEGEGEEVMENLGSGEDSEGRMMEEGGDNATPSDSDTDTVHGVKEAEEVDRR
ncbi:RF-1 domain-containing protein [Aspergillus cavernicola]|uniref:RF-1 domain-containing protein n=1 Tax=Aspergillus cavernicola TaxID=176166 RepID=A0ABR4ILZ2_9EURO